MNIDQLGFDYGAPPLVARYRAVFWEPVIGTGERVVAVISLEASPTSTQTIPAGSYVVIAPDRLRAMLGRQRGMASAGVLNEVAQFLTHHQASGIAIDHLELPFRGLSLGPIQAVRGYSIHQLVDAAVRTVSAFGNAEDLFVDENSIVPRHTIKTKQFLKSLCRHVAGDDKKLKERFDYRFQTNQGQPEMTIDYAFKQWMVQVTSLPVTPRQAMHSLREAQSKLYELDQIRKGMIGNAISPILMVNEDALAGATTAEQRDQAMQMLERLQKLAVTDELELIQAADAEAGARVLLALA